MIPNYELAYENKPPRMFQGAVDNLRKVGTWFCKELFTYIWVCGSYVAPHVFPLEIQDNFFARKWPYQLVGHGVTKGLKDSNKSVWPQFPLSFCICSLENYQHVELEIPPIEELKLTIMPF